MRTSFYRSKVPIICSILTITALLWIAQHSQSSQPLARLTENHHPDFKDNPKDGSYLKDLGQSSARILQKKTLVTIPKIIHQYWPDYHIPPNTQSWISSWESKNTDWQHWFWTQDAVDKFFKKFYPSFQKEMSTANSTKQHRIIKEEIVRYLIIYEFGGLFAELDVECLRPLNRALAGKVCVLAEQPAEHALLFQYPTGSKLLSSALLMCRPHHPFYKMVIDSIKAGTTVDSSPVTLSTLYNSYMQNPPTLKLDYISVAPANQFNPSFDVQATQNLRIRCAESNKTKQEEKLCQKLVKRKFQNEPIWPSSYTDHKWLPHDYDHSQPQGRYSKQSKTDVRKFLNETILPAEKIDALNSR
ncbi:uncharacterized protein LOC106180932 [Lingula anatina]|uniref:Uncharacterized protein LOC106180932 n=1 Tax=Lingula anatina TaxID=7574 RepID=A0A1S3KDM7_LINAN|nr:uncharacterized protein LOC106180932 [Lingula anatina]|eukprot:XP_013420559.1 uncharacterized protein LOC106180932 [Lingula anatina]